MKIDNKQYVTRLIADTNNRCDNFNKKCASR